MLFTFNMDIVTKFDPPDNGRRMGLGLVEYHLNMATALAISLTNEHGKCNIYIRDIFLWHNVMHWKIDESEEINTYAHL